MAVATRRLPGIRFQAEAPPPLTVLPRMDVAVFVGFAAAGPIDVPVAVRDPAQFADVFGVDATLFADGRTGENVRAHLGPAVRAFFRNGGRRCFVVRVAGPGARASTFAIPGIVARSPDGGLEVPRFRGRSEGSWSDRLRVASALVEEPIATTAVDTAAWQIELAAVQTARVAAGDLLRVSLPASGYTVYVAVGSVHGTTVVCDAHSALWLARKQLGPAGMSGTATYVDGRGAPQTAPVRVERDPDSPSGDLVQVTLSTRPPVAPAPGALLRAELGGDELWVAVATSEPDGQNGVVVRGDPFWPVAPPARAPRPDVAASVDVCTFELWTTDGTTRRRLGSLGFAPGNARHAAALPNDVELFAERATAPVTSTPPPFWSAASEPRFPLAGPGAGTLLYPLGMGALPEPALGALLPAGTPLERDGLASFDASLFLDERLAGTGVEALPAEVDFYRLGGEPRLRGVHAALGLDEATIVAVPDAVQRGWSFAPGASGRAPRHRHPHQRRPWFEACGRLHPPQLHATAPDETGSLTLTWHALAPHLVYVLQEARDPEFAAASELYRGHTTSVVLHGRGGGTFYYRVRAERDPEIGPWSTPVTVSIATDGAWSTSGDSAYDPSVLLAVQAGTLRMAAARGDLFAFLSLPDHYRDDRAVAHVGALRDALGGGDVRALGYGALYHPWPITTEADDPTQFRPVPPDGTIVGSVARRAFERGAWVAPANDPLRDVIALLHPVERAQLQRLQDAQLNVLRHEPHGFLVLSADTLTDDVDVRPVDVRRLLQLLRRAALLHGPRYVFEPNDDALRRRIQRAFEDLLALLFRLGAFAGATASEAYRVEVGDPPNNAASIDAGRLIVQLKVAPSLPLRFLTVRLVERAERGLQLEGM